MAEHDIWDGEEFSDEQIKQHLQNAEQRLLKISCHDPYTTASTVLQNMSKLKTGPIAQPYVTTSHDVARADPCRLLNAHDRQLSNSAKRIEDPIAMKQKAAIKSQSLGTHFNMPRTDLDPALKADLSLLRLRGVLDPKQHYKKDSTKSLVSEFSEVGRIIEGPLEYKNRLSNRERRDTFVKEVLTNQNSTGRFENKYNEIQSIRTSGKRSHFKKLKSRRSQGVRKP